jgi:hypothetical protein
MSDEHRYWQELVGVALLGTDRRHPPTPPAGPLLDLSVEQQGTSAAHSLLQQVAATAAVRRAAFVPRPPVARPVSPSADHRPVTPPSASHTWRRIVADWALLEDEWLVAVLVSGRRLAPELVPGLLARHRGDAVRHARVVLAGGSVATWLIEQSPALGCTKRAVVAPEVLMSVPELAITPDLAALRTAPAARAAASLADSLTTGALGAAHRQVLQHLLARLPRESLPEVVAALDGIDPGARSVGLAFALCDLARLRLLMLTELENP